MSEIEAKRKKVEELEAGNQRSYTELCQAIGGQVPMDTSDARREIFIQKLVEWGIISEVQYLDFELAFHAKVEEALNGFWAQFREQQAQAQRANLHVVQKPTKLVDGNGRPLN